MEMEGSTKDKGKRQEILVTALGFERKGILDEEEEIINPLNTDDSLYDGLICNAGKGMLTLPQDPHANKNAVLSTIKAAACLRADKGSSSSVCAPKG